MKPNLGNTMLLNAFYDRYHVHNRWYSLLSALKIISCHDVLEKDIRYDINHKNPLTWFLLYAWNWLLVIIVEMLFFNHFMLVMDIISDGWRYGIRDAVVDAWREYVKCQHDCIVVPFVRIWHIVKQRGGVSANKECNLVYATDKDLARAYAEHVKIHAGAIKFDETLQKRIQNFQTLLVGIAKKPLVHTDYRLLSSLYVKWLMRLKKDFSMDTKDVFPDHTKYIDTSISVFMLRK